jgi:hypothetical protein
MSADHEDRNPLRALTKPARVLAVICIMFGLLVFWLAMEQDIFPDGFYPLIVLMLPGIGGALALFLAGCVVFWLCGIPVWRLPEETSEAPDSDAESPTDTRK